MQAVNLLPPERRGIRSDSGLISFVREPLLVAVAALAVLVVAFLGYSAQSAGSKAASKNAAIRDLDAQLAKLKPAQPAASTGASRLTAVTTLAGGRTTWDGFLGTLSRVVPEDVWLLSLSAQAPAPSAPITPASSSTSSSSSSSSSSTSSSSSAPAPAAAPTGVTFTGYTYSQPSVARMMRRLELVPWLQNVSLMNSTKTAINEHTVYQFTLGANFVPLPEVGT